ncbi:MAG: LysR family substrate-binding domain-containing protein, partial [Cellulomonas sp.]
MSEPPAAEPADPAATDDPARFRLLLVPGVVPASWVRTWRERVVDVPLELVHAPAADAGAVLARGEADAALLRLPVDRDVLSAIPLYVETTVVVLPKDHVLTALDEVAPDDLAEETLITPADDVLRWADAPGEPSLLPPPATTEEAVALVSSGVGLLLVPQSLARLHHRKDLTYRPLTDAPGSQAALAWLADRDGDPLVEELIGIVRGRTVNSSRGRGAAGSAPAGAERADARSGRSGGPGKGSAGKAASGRGATGRGGAATR